ncbi:hypothetical protein [Paenibacillus taichungensis]
MAEIGFARLVRSFLRKKIEHHLDEDIEVYSENIRSHQISFSFPYLRENIIFISPKFNGYTVEVYYNEKYITKEVAEKITNDFVFLLNKHGFDALLMVESHKSDTYFIGVDPDSKAIADILNALSPFWTTDRLFSIKDTNHRAYISSDFDFKQRRVKILLGSSEMYLNNIEQAAEWITKIRQMDLYINQQIDEIKKRYTSKEFTLNVEVTSDSFRTTSYKARLNEKKLSSVKGIDRLFDSVRSKINDL